MANYTLKLFNQGSTTAYLTITSTSETKNYQISQVEYEKKLFSPCFAEVTIAVTDNSGDNKLPAVTDFTNAYSAELDVGNNPVGKDYIVYQIKPMVVEKVKKIVLTLYSRDKLLTLDKFCHVYLNQRLGADIIAGMLGTGGQLASCDVKYAVDTARLQLTDIEITVKDSSNPPKDVPKNVELIQPYRVQYNEDFYSFISRIASVCGEFLFFEDGKLQLGVNTSTKEYKIIDNLAIKKVEKSSYKSSGLTIRSYYKDYRYKEDTEKIEEKDFTGDEDAAFDEYFDVYDKTDLPDSVKRETATPKPYFKFFQDALCSKLGIAVGAPNTFTITSIIASIIYNVGQEVGVSAVNQAYINKQFKKNVFEDKQTQSPKFISEQQEKGDKLSQFSDLDSCGKIMHRFFSEVRKREQQADLDKLTLQVNTDSVYVKLGSLVGYNNTIYVVTRICGKYDPDVTEIEIVPKISVTISAYSSDTNEYKNTSVDRYVPPYNKCPELPAAQPQVAIVADVADPRYMGRVRIRYPWQNAGDVSSPWIRILSPLASKKKNIHFEPAVDDEVMVGYIGGNIDRPYVAGSLFNKDTPIHGSLYLANNSTIRVGSQKLDFKGGTYDEWINDFLPGWGTVIQFLPGVSDKMSDFGDSVPVLENLKGNTTLTDAYGFWTIKGDTAARSVTIESLWGKVSINAFTGINIESAGDIKIKGKNIDILASNNVNIQSGLAIKEEKDAAKFEKMDTFSELGAAVVGQLADIVFGRVDMSLLRTIRDLWAPPKEGTLKVKSYRNLLLEAGDGAAFYHPIYNRQYFFSSSAKKNDDSKYQNLLTDLLTIRSYTIAYCTKTLYEAREQLIILRNKLNTAVNAYTKLLEGGDIVFKSLDDCLKDIAEKATIKDNVLQSDKIKKLKEQQDAEVKQVEDNGVKLTAMVNLETAINGFLPFKDETKYEKYFVPKCKLFAEPDNNNIETYNKLLTEGFSNLANTKEDFKNYNWINFHRINASGVDKLLRPLYKKRTTETIATFAVEGNINDRSDWEKSVMKWVKSSAPTMKDFILGGALSDAKNEFVSVVKTKSEYAWTPDMSGRIMMSQEPGMSQTLDDKGELITTNIPMTNDELILAIQRVLMSNDSWNTEWT